MVKTSDSSASNRFVFFGAGAYFSTCVLEGLVKSDRIPLAIAVPEFSYQRDSFVKGFQIEQSTHLNPLTKMAEAQNIPCVFAPAIHANQLIKALSTIEFDFILVACWPYLLSNEVCQLANKAALNLHPSLLPKYRGANPVANQVKNAEQNLGVSLHLLDQGFDTGNIVKQAGFKSGCQFKVSVKL